jgi:hypothetical protein
VEDNLAEEANSPDYAWTFPNTMLFTITSKTTVGYGHISPKTFEGQIFCIFYSLIGEKIIAWFDDCNDRNLQACLSSGFSWQTLATQWLMAPVDAQFRNYCERSTGLINKYLRQACGVEKTEGIPSMLRSEIESSWKWQPSW